MPRNSIFNQKRVPLLGEVVESVFSAMPIISAFSYVSTTIILYEMVKIYILGWLPWMNIGYFVGFLALLFAPIIILTYKYIIPSVWHFRSSQMSYVEKKMDEQTQKIDELTRQVAILLKDKGG